MTKKKPDFLRDLDTAIMDELTGGGIKENAAGLVGTLTQIKEIKQLCGLPFCGYMAKLETARPSGVPDEVTVVFAEDVPYRAYNGGVYEMDLTRTAVNSFATHCSKLKPEIEGSALKSLEKTLQHKPNYFMDTTKFIKRLATYVAVEHTAFIIPIEDEYGRLCGWYPLRAQRCEVVEAAGQVYLRYLFANGEHGAIEFERVGIMTDFEYTQ